MKALGGIVRMWRFGVPVVLALALAGATAATNDEAPPDTLRIDNNNFKVEMGSFSDSYAGMTYFDKKLIRIDPSSTSTLRRKVYLHELMHVAWHGGRPSDNKEQRFTEEEAIQELVPGLLKLLEQNPAAVEYLRQTNGASIAQVQVKK